MAKYASFGTLFQIGDGATSETFTTVSGVQDIDGPEYSREIIDVTAHDSPGGYEEILPSFKRTGPISFPLVFDPADTTHDATTGLRSFFEDGNSHNFRMIGTDTGSQQMDFSGYVVNFTESRPVAGAWTATVQIKPTGQPTFS